MLTEHFISFLIWIPMVFGHLCRRVHDAGSNCNCKEIEDLKRQNNNLQDQFNTLQEQLAKLLESNNGYEAWLEDMGSANSTESQSGKVGILEAIRVDGGWGSFSEWSQCSVTCGGGVQFRNRTCNNPSPHNGGKPCSGDGVEQEGCNSDKCYGTKEDMELLGVQQDRMIVLMVGGKEDIRRNSHRGATKASVEIVTEHGGCSNHDIPPLPEGRRGGAVGVLVHTQESENRTLEQVEVLMFCGGQMGLMEKADCWTLDFSLMEWNTAPSLLHATAFPAYTSLKERFYVVGGYHRGNGLDHLQIYSEGQWQLGKPLPSKRYGACVNAYLNYLVVAGGWDTDPNMVTQKEIFVYSERSRKWKKLTTPDSYIGRAQHSCATITYKNTSAIALVGGLSNHLNKTWIRPWRIDMLLLNRTGISWDHEDMEPVGAWQPAVGVSPGGELVVAGGRNTDTGIQIGEVKGWSPGRTSWEHLGNLTTPRDQAAVLNLDLKWAWLAKRCKNNL